MFGDFDYLRFITSRLAAKLML